MKPELKERINEALLQGKAVIIKRKRGGLVIKPNEKVEVIYLEGDEK